MIPIDKILHFFAGYAIADLAYHLHPDFGGWIILFAVGAGLAKELYDKYIKKSVFDWKDLVVTILGGFGAVWVSLIK